MKFGDREFKSFNIRKLTITRGKGTEPLVLTFGPASVDDYEKYYPEPKVPTKQKRGSDEWIPNPDDKKYKEALKKRNDAFRDYTVIKSMEYSKVDWDTVNIADPDTWSNWKEDLKNCGFSAHEIQLVQIAVMEANSYTDQGISESEESFLATQAEAKNQENIQEEEISNTSNGEQENGSESNLGSSES